MGELGPSQELGVTFGISPATNARLRGAMGRFEAMTPTLRLRTQQQLVVYAQELRKRLQEVWKRKGHDTTGTWKDPSLWNPDYKHSIDQIEVKVDGLNIEIVMRGGWVFVQYGTQSHVIEARNGPYLTFQRGPGQWGRAKSVRHPGTKPDDVLGEAVRQTDLPTVLRSIVAGSVFETWGYAADRFGNQYTGGEQARFGPNGDLYW